jgi:hypothetical protein
LRLGFLRKLTTLVTQAADDNTARLGSRQGILGAPANERIASTFSPPMKLG